MAAEAEMENIPLSSDDEIVQSKSHITNGTQQQTGKKKIDAIYFRSIIFLSLLLPPTPNISDIKILNSEFYSWENICMTHFDSTIR